MLMSNDSPNSFIDNFPSPILLVDKKGNILRASQSFNAIIGLDASQLTNSHISELNGFTKEQILICLKPCSRSNSPLLVPLKFENVITKKPLSTKACRIKALDEAESFNILIFVDVSKFNLSLVELKRTVVNQKSAIKELHHKNEELRVSREQFSVTLNSIGDAVISTDQNSIIEYMNPAAVELTGWLVSDAYGKHLEEIFKIIDENTRLKVDNPVGRVLKGLPLSEPEKNNILVNKQGNEIFIEDSAAPMCAATGEVSGAVIIFKDITQLRQDRRQLKHYATHDSLTGLFNRREFERQLQLLISSASDVQNKSQHCVCYFDLDQFKVVNDNCGHLAGDELLKQISQIVTASIRASDTVARIGGDEFVLLMEFCSLDSAIKICEKLSENINAFSFVHDKQLFKVTASYGLVQVLEEFSSINEVMNAADTACYLAKERGRNRIEIYTPDEAELYHRQNEAKWVPRIVKAIKQSQFCLFAQIILPINPNLDCHFEILTRMIGDNGEFIPPGVFLPSAERYGLVSDIDYWVIDQTFELLNKHLDFFASIGSCAINLSGASLTSSKVLKLIQQKLRQLPKIQATKICFEITETVAISNLIKAQHFIQTVSSFGCQFALDDFGSGLSSFGYLKNLTVDYLKIDGLFVKDIVSDKLDRAMVNSINEIGQLMGLKTIAEFVENDDIKMVLSEIGVDYVQGYGIHKPEPLVELIEQWSQQNQNFTALLRNNKTA